VALHETRLQELRDGEHSLRLRLADRAVAVLSARGGMLDTAALRSALEAEEVPASVPALRALVALGAASLIPSVLWDAASDLWLDAANQTVLHDGSLDRARRAFLTGARLALKRTGAVSLTRVANATPLPHDHAISLLFGPTSCTRVSGYLVPDVQEESRLSRRALEMATVSPGIGIEDIRLGVRRIVPKPIRLSAPVVRAVLERHAAFRLDGGAVYAVEQLPLDQLLYPADVILIGALRERGGVMLFPEVKALLSSAGIRQGYFLRAAHVAWLVGLRGAFGLRGHPGIAGLAETNERRTPGLPRSRVFVKLLWSDNDSAAVRYRVIPASLRGVLRLPNRLVERLREPGPEWTVTATPPLPDTGTVAVGTEVGTLWDLRPWLVAVSARRGQHIEVSVALTARRVTLRLIDAETAAEDEARWAQEQLLRWAHRPSHSGEEKTREERGIGPRGGRPRMPTVTVKEFGDYFTVPNDVHDLSDATFHRLKGTPAPDSDLLVAALPSFPLAPGTTGVVMCLVFQLTASKGRRRLYSDLLETRILERATAVTWADATHLVRNLDRHLVRGRLSLAWREYRSPSATENGDLAATQDHISASESGHANHGTTE
jgi:hypothetical protein